MPFPDRGSQFQPGQSGNPAGRPKGSILAALRERLKQTEPDGRTLADVLADALVSEARRGNLKAIREVLDRTEGRPRQLVTLAEEPIKYYHVGNSPDDL